MSGGSLDYIYSRVQDAACSIRGRSRKPIHTAFADHLDKVATALHDIEWAWSGDTADGDEEAAIRKVISAADILATTLKAAMIAKRDLEAAIEQARLKP